MTDTPYIVTLAQPQHFQRCGYIYYESQIQRGVQFSYSPQDVDVIADDFAAFAQDPFKVLLISALNGDTENPENIHGLLGASCHPVKKYACIEHFYTLPMKNKKPGSPLMRFFLGNISQSGKIHGVEVNATENARPVYENYGFIGVPFPRMRLDFTPLVCS